MRDWASFGRQTLTPPGPVVMVVASWGQPRSATSAMSAFGIGKAHIVEKANVSTHLVMSI
jgi:hypothetical protein